ncbi:hypothetical protein PV08_10314 [Exophiala spinifera]|uniref:Ras-GAP domain-containing protein n=1 Tax=Exophiala spinifera TaxID=91928 RepID=A0A0D2AXA4_9EURO|nr:uncharacterized protein PV08_10314 [Exophiala spinifera]KIW11015.1 hypothetical protein PV08_10314 [Exophiala spinifera]
MKPGQRDEALNGGSQSRSRPQVIQRRASRQASSQDRHGRMFEEHEQRTIRAATPDSAAYTTFNNDSTDGSQVHSPVLPSTRTRNPQRRRETSTSISNTDEESTIDRRRRRAQTRTNTKDDAPSDASPGSFITKTRKRLGSIATSPSLVQRQDEDYGSIGFPSVVRGSDALEHTDSQNPPKTPRRPFSPNEMFGSAGGLRSPKLLDIDSARILHLMKTTCGRMHGILFFRPLHTSAWASGYCAINVAPGSLVCQTKGEVSQFTVLISDLRGCTVRTHYDYETQSTYLSVLVASSTTGYQLRPPVPETFDSWLAALLCWQPLRPKGIHNKMTKPQPVSLPDEKSVSQRRLSGMSGVKSTAIVKVGKMLLWDGPLPSGSQLVSSPNSLGRSMTEDNYHWRRVNCTLHENGTFRILVDSEPTVLCVTHLSELSRSAVQRLDESVLRMPYCLAVCPQYRTQPSSARFSRPMVMCLESNTALEAWYVLLRAFTVPELYGPERALEVGQSASSLESRNATPQSGQSMFRIERSLSVKITEAKFAQQFTAQIPHEQHKHKTRRAKEDHPKEEGVYAEVMLGNDLRARTTTKTNLTAAFWAEEFNLEDIPPSVSNITIAVKFGNPAEKEWTMVADTLYDISADAGYLSGVGGLEISSHDPVFGRLDVPLDDLENQTPVDKWWPLLDNNDHSVGTLLVRFSLQEAVVLMEDEYKELAAVLENFANGLTTQISRALGPDLRQLSDILLDIFQALGSANDWLASLIEEEIDGVYRETPPTRMRFSGRIHSNDSYESAEQREMLVRDLSRSATMEANLLFRGNSLVTKALDAHMRRLGKEYLEEVLGEKLRKIVERDPDCEVDPTRVRSNEHLEKNWANLIFLTSTIWKSIRDSVASCPLPLRFIFRHVRSCAEDRYGPFIRTVRFTSVSGFLFLRFFCPAILNPKLFGLINDLPPDRTKRTFTLIAKSLNALGAGGRFGTKEPWMEPMNKFLVASAAECRNFIDDICAVNASQMASVTLEPQFAAPKQIRSRLPPLSREGLPSLPYLLDYPKLLAQLADLWVSHIPENINEASADDPIRVFHALCLELSAKSKECLKAAEQAERPSERSQPSWERLVYDQQKETSSSNMFGAPIVKPRTSAELTALPQTADTVTNFEYKHAETSPNVGEGDTTPSSLASIAWDRRIPFPQRATDARAMTNSTNSSTASVDFSEENRTRVLPGSRDGSSKNRLFELMSSSSRKKAKASDRPHDEAHEI